MGRFIPEPVEGSDEWSNKWSTSVGEMKAALEGLPDDYEIVLENADVDDINIAELRIIHLFPPTPYGNAGLVVLGQGQVVSGEYDYETRLDVQLHTEDSGVKTWNEEARRWT
ncbi:hypothetical protein HOS75_gp044 [Gordonia phage SteveFrench]|uniref:Uncharacterized protein n=1 Tax=Gordonia phage SteveFrench TaxID=2079281 RepID=A0A2K9VEJ5_9CAUD|nr:hypothetical protein HOS75_gp044 [Gordonia phage SteveFrench]AUV60686.1 hypothetical protein SEA_STEVEFRENCH_84 [Gordonia phage SteveFrench]